MRSVFHILLVLSLASTATVWGAGGITGRVASSTTGEPLRDARVFVLGHSQSLGMTDLDGRYFIEGVPAGTHALRIFRSGYDLLAVADVEVTEGETRRLDVTLAPFDAESSEAENAPTDGDVGGEIFELPALVVTASELQSVDANLLQVRQRSSALSDAMGSESMSRLGLGDAAEALGRVTGTSVVDGKYVVIRGLGDRYTNTMLNGITVPSADPDRRAVQLDQFPSELLESVVTAKSFTPDQPGSFSGGSVNLQTKSFPDQRFLRTSVKMGMNSNVVGEDLLTIPGGGRDWLARDDGTRSLPSDFDFGDVTYSRANQAAKVGDFSVAKELDHLLGSFDNRSFYPTAKSGEPNFGMSVALGDRFHWKEESAFGYMLSFKYDRSSSHYTNGTVGRYQEGDRTQDFGTPAYVAMSRVFSPDPTIYQFFPYIEAGAQVPEGTPPFGVTRSVYSVDWGSLAQIAYTPSSRHEFTLRYYHNQSADDSIKRGVGESAKSDSGDAFRENIDLLYTERAISSAQMEGKSVFEGLGEGLRLDWRLAKSRSTQDQPDYRSLEFKWNYIFSNYDPAGMSLNRYFRKLEDDNTEGAIDLTLPFTLSSGRSIELKVGGLYSEGERIYRGRQFRFEHMVVPSDPTAAREWLESFPNPVGLISINEATNTMEFGSSLRKITSNINYDGEQVISAGYAMVDWRFLPSWRAIVGARYELTDLTTIPRPESNIEPEIGQIDQWEILPAASVVYELRENMNLRAAYGRTLARPTYREMAAVRVYEPFTDEFWEGNPDLELTLIDNFDLRWEFFPRSSELLAVSLFYKKLADAIEHTFDKGAIKPQNVEDGVVYGIELEYRQDLAVWSEALRGLSVGFNFALIESEVTIPELDLAAIRELIPDADDKRPLFGQSNYTFNADVSYFVVPWNTTFTLSYNVAGERLHVVTTGPLPDIYEQPSPTLDFNIAKTFRHGWAARLSVDNILDSVREKTLTYAGQSFAYERYRVGRTYALSVAKDF